MKKRLFQILDDMNQEDTKNGTKKLRVCPDLISVDKVKGGCKVSMGAPESVMFDIMNKKLIPIIVLVDSERYFQPEPLTHHPQQ